MIFNMLKYFFVLFFPLSLFSENTDSLILVAEDLIMQSNYIDAKNIYYDLSQKSELWEKDMINGLLCSLESKDIEKSSYFIQKLLERGAPPEYFENELSKYDFFKSKKWEELKNNRPSFNRESNLITTINRMFEIDQKGRIAGGDSIEIVDFKNYLLLKNIVKNEGFPTEKSMGFDYKPKGYETQSNFDVLMIHAIKSRPYEWGEYLPQLFKERKISQSGFIYYSGLAKSCIDIQLACLPPTINAIKVENKIYTCCCELKSSIDANRARYGIESIDSYLKKTIFKTKNKNLFILGGSIPSIQSSSPLEKILDELNKRGFNTVLE